jgi:hypothetical protein
LGIKPTKYEDGIDEIIKLGWLYNL